MLYKNFFIFYFFLLWIFSSFFYLYEFVHRVLPIVISSSLLIDFNINVFDISNLSTLYYLFYFILQIPAGVLLDIYGLKLILLFSSLFVCLGSYLFSFSYSYYDLELSRILISIGSSFSFISCLNIIHSFFNKKYFSIFVGLTNFIGVVGAFFGTGFISYFLIDLIGWRGCFLFLSEVSFLFFIFFFLLLLFYNYSKSFLFFNSVKKIFLMFKKIFFF